MAAFIFLISFIMFILPVGVIALTVVEQWLVFKKAGKEGWEAIIPVYNNIVLIEIVGLPMWYIALLFVPFANIYALVMIYLELAKRFNKDTGFGLGLVFLTPIFLGILAFDKKCVYTKPVNTILNFCTKCGHSINIQDKYCTGCGEKINNKNLCLNCGNKIDKNDIFCKNCGTKI